MIKEDKNNLRQFRGRLVQAGKIFLPAVFVVCLLLSGCASSPTVDRDKANTPAAKRLSAEEQLRFNELYLNAVAARASENEDFAYDCLSRALSLNPDAPEATFEMALLQMTMISMLHPERERAADSLLRRTVELAPENYYYKEILANYLVHKGGYAEATKIYEELVEKFPASTEKLSLLIQLYEATKNNEGAIRTLERLERLDGSEDSYTIEKVRNYLAMSDTAQAYGIIRHLIEEHPDDVRYKIIMASTLMGNADYERGFRQLKEVLDKEPQNSVANVVLLDYYQRTGNDSLFYESVSNYVVNPNFDADNRAKVLQGYLFSQKRAGQDSIKALRLVENVLEKETTDLTMTEFCTEYVIRQNMPLEAQTPYMEKILLRTPDNTRARLVLLRDKLIRQDSEGMKELCKEGEIYNPEEMVFYYYDGLGELIDGNTDAAVDAFERGTKAEGTDDLKAELYCMLGDALHEQGNKEKSYEAYEECLRLNPDNVLALNNYAYFLSIEERDLEKAETMSKRTIEIEPDNATYLDTYAWILYQRKQYQQARIYIDKTIECMEPSGNNATLLDHAGDIYLKLGERRAARDFWLRALEQTDDPAEQKKLKQKLKK